LLGFDGAGSNERSALILLGLLGLRPADSWADATRGVHGVTSLMNWIGEHFDKHYAPNTRETIRRQTLRQFVDATLVLFNPDNPLRSLNSPKRLYEVEEHAFALLCQFGTPQWDKGLPLYLERRPRLQKNQKMVEKLRVSILEQEIPSAHHEHRHDLFICHASEDKESVARPLAEVLISRGLKVWLDELELTVGDSLNSRIEAALVRSRFGIVILSPAFFTKEWPQRELAGLAAREVDAGSKVILPVWHNVNRDYIAQRAPTLADRVGASTDRGLQDVADKLLLALERAEVCARAGLLPEPMHGL
jgi:hypothetical protein